MNFIERFNFIINRIEENTRSEGVDAYGLMESISQELATNMRNLTKSFTFITGDTIARYIKQRRMIHALCYKIENRQA